MPSDIDRVLAEIDKNELVELALNLGNIDSPPGQEKEVANVGQVSRTAGYWLERHKERREMCNTRREITALRSLQKLYIEISGGEFIITSEDFSAARMPLQQICFNFFEAKKLRSFVTAHIKECEPERPKESGGVAKLSPRGAGRGEYSRGYSARLYPLRRGPSIGD